MNAFRTWRRSTWFVPAVSGILILAPFGVEHLLGGAWNVTISPQWWIDAGEHARGSGNVFTLANALMLVAAILAGRGIVVTASRTIAVRFISIGLLVSIAAIGAIVIGNSWKAAAVTFLFCVGRALETGTGNRTRAAQAELVAVAPDTAVVLRDGEQTEVTASQVRTGEVVLVKNGAKVPADGRAVADTTLARIIHRVEEAQLAKAETQAFIDRFSRR